MTKGELKKYLDTDNGVIPMLRHPLYCCPFSGSNFEAEHAIKFIKAKEAKLEGFDKDGNYFMYIWMYERPWRLEALGGVLTTQRLSNAEEAKLILSVWVDSESPHVNRDSWALLFRRIWLRNDKCMIDTEESDNSLLPSGSDSVTLYRGSCKNGKCGLSWTTSLETAKWFANRRGHGGQVWEMKPPLSEVITTIGSRGESEVIVNPNFIIESNITEHNE